MIRLGIVGLGPWGKRLVESVQGKSDKVKFAAAYVPRPEKVADYVAANSIKLAGSLDELFADPAIDAIVSCGPANLHGEHSLAALNAGKPVLAIKPMALNAAQAQALGEAASKKGLLLALGYNRCFMPNITALRTEIANGALGQILHTEGDFCVHRHFNIKEGGWKGDPLHSPPGSLSDHVLYLTIEALGPLVQVHAISQHGVSDNRLSDVTATLAKARSGASAFLTAIGTTANEFRFHVFGSKGWAEARGERSFRLETAGGRSVTTEFLDADPERLEVEAFADALTGHKPFPVTAQDAVHSVAVLEAIARSANSGQPVSLG
ncbi:MAG: Gfo/Idh/MocA family oxidoreductase [Beijerinckiaceae bacterium]|nr:Gfo/Idh/MocA family oxidoreductase [Beijerinckiaceae bacterium]